MRVAHWALHLAASKVCHWVDNWDDLLADSRDKLRAENSVVQKAPHSADCSVLLWVDTKADRSVGLTAHHWAYCWVDPKVDH